MGCRRRRPSRYGLRTRPGSARRTARSGSGPSAERDLASLPTSAMTTPICSAPSARRGASAPARTALRRHRYDAASPRRNLAQCRGGRPRRAASRPSRVAHHGQARCAGKHHPDLPAVRAPELNPVENVWQYLRQNWLSNTVFENYDAIIDAACAAWQKLIAQPETITSIGMRDWAHVGQPL